MYSYQLCAPSPSVLDSEHHWCIINVLILFLQNELWTSEYEMEQSTHVPLCSCDVKGLERHSFCFFFFRSLVVVVCKLSVAQRTMCYKLGRQSGTTEVVGAAWVIGAVP